MSSAAASSAHSVTPEQELAVLKLLLRLHELGDDGASEKLRLGVRKALTTGDAAAAEQRVADLLRRYTRAARKLDGSYEAERLAKRQRREAARAQGSRFVELSAGEGTEEEEEDDGDGENEEGFL